MNSDWTWKHPVFNKSKQDWSHRVCNYLLWLFLDLGQSWTACDLRCVWHCVCKLSVYIFIEVKRYSFLCIIGWFAWSKALLTQGLLFHLYRTGTGSQAMSLYIFFTFFFWGGGWLWQHCQNLDCGGIPRLLSLMLGRIHVSPHWYMKDQLDPWCQEQTLGGLPLWNMVSPVGLYQGRQVELKSESEHDFLLWLLQSLWWAPQSPGIRGGHPCMWVVFLGFCWYGLAL